MVTTLLVIIITVIAAIATPASRIEGYWGLTTINAIQAILIFGLTPIIYLRVTKKQNPLPLLDLNKSINHKQILFIILYSISAIPAISLLGELNSQIQFPESLSTINEYLRKSSEAYEQIITMLLSSPSRIRLAINLITIAVIPAITEEILFRGWLQRTLNKRLNTHSAVWIAAVIFSIIHFDFNGFIPRIVLGAGLGYLYATTKSLWSSILAHFINNALAVIAAYITYNNLSSIDFEHIGNFDTWYLGVASIAIASTIIIKFIKSEGFKSTSIKK